MDRIWNSAMKRRDFLRASMTATLGASGLLAAACASGSSVSGGPPSPQFATAKIDGDLNFFNWSLYLSPDLITGFEKHYGVKVHQTYFTNMSEMMTKLASNVPYDVTFPTMDYAIKLIKSGFLQPIDHSQLKNWGQIPAYYQNPWYDPGATYSVPYAIWTTGIAWRSDQVSGMTGSWSDLWNLAPKYPGKTWLLDDFQEVLGMSLLHLGYEINSTDPGQLDKAANAVIQLKPNLRGFSTCDITNLENGTAWIHHAWSGDVFAVISAVANPQTIHYETCKEGVPTGNDTMVIPKNAKHPGTAMLFIDWMLDPAHVPVNIKYFGYPMVTTAGLKAFHDIVGASYPFLDVNLDTAIHGLREIAPSGAALQLYDTEWAKVKAG